MEGRRGGRAASPVWGALRTSNYSKGLAAMEPCTPPGRVAGGRIGKSIRLNMKDIER